MQKYRRDIDGLRTIAVLPVVFGHAGIPGFSGGYIGVDVFFVISGFLITSILMRELEAQKFSIVHFYEKRARRILPALFAVIIFCLIAGWFILLPSSYMDMSKSILAAILFVSNIWLWKSTGDYFAVGADLEPMLHTWSLAVEEQFYIVFPILLWMLASRSKKTTILVITFISLISFVLSIWATSAYPSANFYLTPTRVWELGMGALLAYGAFPKIENKLMIEVIAAAGLSMIIFCILFYTSNTPFPGLTALLPCIGTTAIIWAGSQHQSVVGRLLSLKPMVWVGLISYSLYLWHWPFLVGARILTGYIHLAMPVAISCVVLAIFSAYVSWRYIEQPFRVRGEKQISRKEIFTFSGIGMAALITITLVIVFAGGFEQRFPRDILQNYRNAVAFSDTERDCRRTMREGEFCEIGQHAPENDQTKIMVWGDSHAAAMLPGFERWLTDNKKPGFAAIKDACPPLMGIVRKDMSASHKCNAFNQSVLEYIQQHEDIEWVILAGRWALNAEGSRMTGEPGTRISIGLDSNISDEKRDVISTSDIFKIALTETARRLTDAGKKVLIIEGVPEIGYSVPHAYFYSEHFSTEKQAVPDKSEYLRRNKTANAIIEAVTNQYDFMRMSIFGLFCTEECVTEIDGNLLYRDDNHISTYAAEKFIPLVLDKAFKN